MRSTKRRALAGALAFILVFSDFLADARTAAQQSIISKRAKPAIAMGGPEATIQDFDTSGAAYSPAQCFLPPAPEVLPGGPWGNFLRLATIAPDNNNTIAFDRTAVGAFNMVVADFDFRIKPNPPGRADGLGFALLNTANYGNTGAACPNPPLIAEEPNYTGSLGIGFDIYRSPELNDIGDDRIRGNFSNSISVHFNGAVLSQTDATPFVDMAGGHWIHARIIMKAGGGFSDVSVILTPFQGQPVTVVNSLNVLGLTPYEARALFGARTGGQNADHDIDNVNVQFLSLSHSVFSFETISRTAEENGGAVVVWVTRAGNTSGAASVQFSTADATANAGSDYVATSGTLDFAAGETRKPFNITILNDPNDEGDEAFNLHLSNPTPGNAVGGPAMATTTIFDDEASQTFGHWSSIQWLSILPIHAHLLPNGKVMFWNRFGVSRILDPDTQAISTPAQAGYNLFCSGHSFTADGKLLVTGGHHPDGCPMHDGIGITNASLYDPFLNSWTALDPMNAGRWYPSNLTLANGEVLVISGSVAGIGGFPRNQLPQVWQPGGTAWRGLTDAQDMPPGADLYPRIFLAPDGRVFKASPDQMTWFLNTSGAGAWSFGPQTIFNKARTYGSAVMYDAGKILIVGGGGSDPNVAEFPTASAEAINLNAATPAWASAGSMASARRHLNATALADGKVLVTGGTSGKDVDETAPVMTAEMWEPDSQAWTTLSAMQVPRIYHSVALLLPDGRVLSAGGGEGAGQVSLQNNAEIFSPPYLFKGARPVVTAAPTQVNYGQTFFVETPAPGSITNVNLIRLPSVTHAFDQNQGFNRLTFSQSSNGLLVTAPSNANLCPPGHYMLFILNSNGVPSVARIIQITSTTCSYLTSPTSQLFQARGGSGSVSLNTTSNCPWSATNADSWIVITSSNAGNGNGAVTFEVRENFTGNPRAGALIIGGRVFSVIQNGGLSDACTNSISPRFADFSASGGAGTINVTASGQCAWQATSNVNWINITGSSAGVGSGAVTYTVSANPGGNRAGKIKVAGQTFSVKQKGS